jgi:hypothetical protein
MSTFPSVSDERVCSVTAALDRTMSNFGPIEDWVNAVTGNIDAHAALEANVAMLHLMGGYRLMSCESLTKDRCSPCFQKMTMR